MASPKKAEPFRLKRRRSPRSDNIGRDGTVRRRKRSGDGQRVQQLYSIQCQVRDRTALKNRSQLQRVAHQFQIRRHIRRKYKITGCQLILSAASQHEWRPQSQLGCAIGIGNISALKLESSRLRRQSKCPSGWFE